MRGFELDRSKFRRGGVWFLYTIGRFSRRGKMADGTGGEAHCGMEINMMTATASRRGSQRALDKMDDSSDKDEGRIETGTCPHYNELVETISKRDVHSPGWIDAAPMAARKT